MDPRKLSTGANLLRISTLGLNFVFCTFAGLGLGWVLQYFFHLGDWVMMAGLFLGIITSYIVLFEDLKALNRDMRKPPSP